MNSIAPGDPALQAGALRAIAAFEGLKGLAALISGIGWLGLLHHDVRPLVLELVGHFGLDPAQHFPSILLHYADLLNDTPVSTVLLMAGAYTLVRLTEAYGLWNERPWGEWLGTFSSGIYIPFEIRHLLHEPGYASVAVLSLNVLIVLFLVFQLWRRHQHLERREGRGPSMTRR